MLTADVLLSLGDALVTNIPGAKGYTLQYQRGEGHPPTGVKIQFPDGREILVAGSWREGDSRLNIIGLWPKDRKNMVVAPYEHERQGRTLSITAAENRPAAQIARQIIRRLLPDYTLLYDGCIKRANAESAYEDATQKNIRHLAGVAGVALRPLAPHEALTQFSLYHSTISRADCDVRVSGETATMTIRANTDLAEKILRLLSQECPK